MKQIKKLTTLIVSVLIAHLCCGQDTLSDTSDAETFSVHETTDSVHISKFDFKIMTACPIRLAGCEKELRFHKEKDKVQESKIKSYKKKVGLEEQRVKNLKNTLKKQKRKTLFTVIGSSVGGVAVGVVVGILVVK